MHVCSQIILGWSLPKKLSWCLESDLQCHVYRNSYFLELNITFYRGSWNVFIIISIIIIVNDATVVVIQTDNFSACVAEFCKLKMISSGVESGDSSYSTSQLSKILTAKSGLYFKVFSSS